MPEGALKNRFERLSEEEIPEKKVESLSVQEILRTCEIHPDKPVSLEQIERIFERFPQLITGAPRNFYWLLRRASAADFSRSSRMRYPNGGGSSIGEIGRVIPFCERNARSQQSPFLPRTGKTEREVLLGEKWEESPSVEVRFDIGTSDSARSSPSLVVLFRTTPENARLYCNEGDGMFGNFTSPDDFQFVGIYTTLDSQSPKEALASQAPSPERQIDYQKIAKIVECLIPIPDADVRESLTLLRSLAKKEGMDEEIIEKLATSLQTFATFVKPPPESNGDFIAEVGRCLTVPLSFSSYCKKRLGLEMEEERYGNGVSFYHEVNRIGKILIDWTAKQYSEYQDAPYPRIYHVDEPLFGYAKPRSAWTEEEEQDARELSRLAASGGEY